MYSVRFVKYLMQARGQILQLLLQAKGVLAQPFGEEAVARSTMVFAAI